MYLKLQKKLYFSIIYLNNYLYLYIFIKQGVYKSFCIFNITYFSHFILKRFW